MICPKCSKETIVKDSRKKNSSVVRRRICGCGERFTTKEVIITLRKRNYENKPVTSLAMSESANGTWTVSIDENTPEWAKKMLINL